LLEIFKGSMNDVKKFIIAERQYMLFLTLVLIIASIYIGLNLLSIRIYLYIRSSVPNVIELRDVIPVIIGCITICFTSLSMLFLYKNYKLKKKFSKKEDFFKFLKLVEYITFVIIIVYITKSLGIQNLPNNIKFILFMGFLAIYTKFLAFIPFEFIHTENSIIKVLINNVKLTKNKFIKLYIYLTLVMTLNFVCFNVLVEKLWSEDETYLSLIMCSIILAYTMLYTYGVYIKCKLDLDEK
jgi:hypothetical protein